MKVLVVGGGGREHTLVWKIRQSPLVDSLYCAPGNAGIARDAECVEIKAEDVAGLKAFAVERNIDLTVVGPEAPLVEGIVDEFANAGLKAFGPSRAAARLEGSKSFAKRIMAKAGVPTGEYAEFTDYNEAVAYVRDVGAPIVVKADGLAAGKGVTVAHTTAAAEEALRQCFLDEAFGEAGSRVVVEECLVGEEASILAFTDGKTVVPMASSQDHKPVHDNDEGPNTGGMGAYSPAPVVTPEIERRVYDEVLCPTLRALSDEGIEYRGVLYAGLMITEDGANVLEFNVRFGDPETQVILPRMENDLVEVMLKCVDGTLDGATLDWADDACVTVVMASGGYPGKYRKGVPISGVNEAESAGRVVVFHAGTASREGEVVTNGGRVLGVTALGQDIRAAINEAYAAISKIHFDDMQYRTDIGKKALARMEASS